MKAFKVALLAVLAGLAAVSLLHSAQTASPRSQYQQWKIDHGMNYKIPAQQDQYRLRIFEQNLKEINEHNAQEGNTYKMGLNQFSALSKEEFAQMHLSQFEVKQAVALDKEWSPSNINIDWVSYGAVSPVKDEGACKANYAFSAIGGIEGISAIVFKQQTEYSVQEIVDCTSSYGNQGCNSGTMDNSFSFIRNKGINTESAYPYRGRVQNCQTSSGIFKISGYRDINRGDCTGLDSALTVRPVSVAVDGRNFVNYQSGLFSNCGTQLTLAALLVGATDSFYRLKLSWGTRWGESGYIRLSRNYDVCGICDAASYPLPA